jgi:hypothetical protein
MADMKQDDVDAGQRAAAESLRRQISDLQKGKTPTKSPQSLRDFWIARWLKIASGSRRRMMLGRVIPVPTKNYIRLPKRARSWPPPSRPG